MTAAAITSRRQALRNIGRPKHQPKRRTYTVYRGAPLYRKARPDWRMHLALWLGALVGMYYSAGFSQRD